MINAVNMKAEHVTCVKKERKMPNPFDPATVAERSEETHTDPEATKSKKVSS